MFLQHSSNPALPGQNTGRGQALLRAAPRLSWRPGSPWTRRRGQGAALTSLSLQEQQGGGAGGRLLVALLDAVPLLRGAGDNIIYI